MQHYSRLAAFVALGCAVAAPAGALAQNAAPVSLSQSSPPAYYPPPPATRSPPSAQPKRHRVDLMPIVGYQLSSDVNTSGGDLSVSDEPVYGAAVDVEARPGTSVELMWLYSEPTVRFSGSPVFAGSDSMQVATHYFQIGGTSGIQRGRVYLFGAGTLGAVLFMPDTLRLSNGTSASFSDTWRFAFTFGVGTRIDLARHVGVRFDVRGAAPVYFSSGGFYAGSGGAALTVSGGIPLWQANFLGALVVTL